MSFFDERAGREPHYNQLTFKRFDRGLSMKHQIPAAIITAILALVLAGPSMPAAIQDVDAHEKRPRIGLVLGGGGARGAAHIGVLKELERLRVPVDAIVGTSMGAAVGGLYASGMSVGELEDLVTSVDWAATMSDDPPRRDLTFRRKQDGAQFPINLELGVSGGEVKLPMGVIQGQQLELLLRKLTIDVATVTDFDELPVPFRAIASNIESGELHVLESGDLARSIRASMSVPAILAPARIDGHLLADGGLVGNLPVDVMREYMDVDVIIAVDVEFPLYAAEELDSVLAITEQMLTILIHKETLRQIGALTDDDILIRPELGTFPSTGFGDIADTIEPGVNATTAVAGRLRELALDEAAFAAYTASRTAQPESVDSLAFVRVAEDGRIQPSVLESRLQTRPGDALDVMRLADDADRLYGLDLFEQVSYQLVEEDGTTGVEFQARPKGWGPDTLQFALSLEDDLEGSTAFNVSARLTRSALNRHGAEWRTDLRLGTDPMLLSEFYQPLGWESRLFVAPSIQLRQSNINAFSADVPVARLRTSSGDVGFDLGMEISTWGEARIGTFRGQGKARVKVGDPEISNFDFDTGGAFVQFRLDTLDDPHFPGSGFLADARWTRSTPGMGADARFSTFESQVTGAWSFGNNLMQLGLGYASTVEGDLALQDYFPLGGFLRLSGLERGEISAPHAALAKLVYLRRLNASAGNLFEVPLYLGASVEAGNVWERRADMTVGSARVNGSVFVGLDTYIGPVYVAAGFAESGRTNFYLFLGSPPR
jgi:NTE family protein